MSGRFRWSALLLMASVAAAFLPGAECARAETEVYWYTDEEGVRFYTNMPSDIRYQPMASVEPPRRGGDEKSRPFEGAIVEAAEKYGVDRNLLRAVIKCESNFNHLAVSRAGAQGLMQLMPDTARLVEVSDPFDATENLEGGARYLKYLLDSFTDRKLALAAYNAGEGTVRRYGGIPPYRETQNYVKAVLAQYDRYCTLADGGDVITSEDIQAFTDREGVRLFTNVPWKYSKKDIWKRMDSR
jgi:soluble lytic murein transglycosylase-like protein